ncbi:MAG: tRNA modification GTPase [Bacteriovoracaceae bacterium]
MNFNFSDGPIIACSTGYQGNSAIALIRISGFIDLAPFQPFLRVSIDKLKPRLAIFTDLLDKTEVVDSIVITYFQGPHSYNAENILELSVHGNVLNVERILSLFETHQLARRAYPGEFTYRALKNGKMNLSQVEGLDLMLNAQSEYALKQGLSLLGGDLQESYLKLHDAYLKLKTVTEMHFDFLEDIGEEKAQNLFVQAKEEFTEIVEILNQRATVSDGGLLSPEVVLVGDTNAGKSSLFNKILGESRAIVSAVKGTTRDFISESIQFQGLTFRLIDTAGLRDESSDEIELEGMKLSLSRVKKAFFKILVINPFEKQVGLKNFQNLSFDLIIFTHSDLPQFDLAKAEFLSSGSIEPEKLVGSIEPLSINSKSGSMGPELSHLILNKYNLLMSKSPILLERHRVFIRILSTELNNFNYLYDNESDMAIISHHLNSIGQTIAELIGVMAPDEVLDHLFSNFCIGK